MIFMFAVRKLFLIISTQPPLMNCWLQFWWFVSDRMSHIGHVDALKGHFYTTISLAHTGHYTRDLATQGFSRLIR